MDNLSRVESIFVAALEKRSPEARVAFLDEACGADVDVRRGVERLLRAQEKAGHFLQKPVQAGTIDEPPTECPGTMIGSYKLLEQIGEGGFLSFTDLPPSAVRQLPLETKISQSARPRGDFDPKGHAGGPAHPGWSFRARWGDWVLDVPVSNLRR